MILDRNQIRDMLGGEICKTYLADVISRNRAGLTQEKIKQIMEPGNIIFAAMKMNLDPQVKAYLKDLEAHQKMILGFDQKKENRTIQPIPQNN